MDNTNIPTAEKDFNKKLFGTPIYFSKMHREAVYELMIEFAKFHVNTAKNEYYQIILREGLITEDGMAYLENAYDLSNIK